jgi:aminoglycoside phosphotransferase family enzyme
MKQFPFTFANQAYSLVGLTQEVKDAFLDPVRVDQYRQFERMKLKGLIKPEECEALQDKAMALPFHSKASQAKLSTVDGLKELVALMIRPQSAVTPEFLDALMKEPVGSSFDAAITMARKDSFPLVSDEQVEAELEDEESHPPQ